VARARRRFGQHFLERAWVDKLVAAVAARPTDRIIEIGPGRGAITEPLAAKVERVVAVEIDRDLAASLAARGFPNVEVITGDILTMDVAAIARRLKGGAGAAVRVVGNLPYHITSPILFRLLDASASSPLEDATLMVQAEVAERLVAEPGTAEYGVLTLSTMMRAEVSLLLPLPPGAFRPVPKVRSAVVRFRFRPPPPGISRPELVIDIVRAVFTQRRKTLANALAPFASALGRNARDLLAATGIDPQRRPETLRLQEYAHLASTFGEATARAPRTKR
jgi:16S rRNA (adenine1518-N6/adenine1519-N6)-dimethyltransferase